MFQIYEFLPGAVTRTKQWDNLHYHNVLLELFFLRIHYHMQNKRIYMTLLMRFNWKQLPMWWNKWTGWGVIFWHEGNKNESTTFYIWCSAQIIDLQRISVECILKNHQRKKTLRSVPTDSNSVIEWSRFFFYMKACVIWWLETVFYI